MAIDIAFKADIDLGEGAKSLKSLKQEFKEAQKELDGLTVGSDKYIASLKRLGSIKDDIGDLNDEINAFKPENKLAGLSAVAGGVASGFQAAVGGMALFGGESKELEKQLLKVQAAMAFAEGIKGVLAMGDSFKLLKNSLMSTAVGQKIVTAAQWLWNAAMAANPIGLAIAAVAALVGTVVLLSKVMTANVSVSEKLSKQYDRLKNSAEQTNKVLESEISILEAIGGQETKIFNIRKKQLQVNIELTKIALQKALVELQSANNLSKLLDDRILKQRAAQTEVNKAIDDMKIAMNAVAALDITENKRKSEAAESESKKKLDATEKESNSQIKATEKITKSKESAEKKLEAAKDERAKLEKDLADKAIAEREKNDAAELSSTQSLIEKVKKLKEDEEIRLAGSEQNVLNIKLARDIAEVEAEFEKSNRSIEAYQAKIDAIAAIDSLYMDNSNTIKVEATAKEKIADDKSEADHKASRDGQLAAAQAANQSLQNLSDLFFEVKRRNLKKGSAEDLRAAKSQFKINKALSIATATITGIQAVMAAYSSGAAVPIAGIVLGPAMAIIAGISAAANIAKIASAKFDGGGGGGAVSGGGGSIPSISAPSTGSAPSINAPSSTTTQLNPDGTVRSSGATGSETRVTVLETDITRTQSRVNVMEQASRIE